MDDRASISPTLPTSNSTISAWQDPPDAIADLRSTPELPEIADFVVIGSGISGASIAFGLLDEGKGKYVVMLEARQTCSGATGRNGEFVPLLRPFIFEKRSLLLIFFQYCCTILTGFYIGGHTKGASYRSFYDNVQAIGPEEATKIARLEYNTIKAVHAFARLHDIDCERATRDTVDIIYDQGQWGHAVRSIELMRKLMPEDLEGAAQYKFHTADEARDMFLCKGEKAVGAISYQAGSLNAYKFVVGLLELCLRKDLNLQTNTPVTAIQRQPNGMWKIHTPRGGIMTKRVVLATNGYTRYLFQKLRSIIVPLRGQITAHRPGTNMPKDGLPTTYSFIYTNGYEYMISRPIGSKFAGDIIMGGGLVKAPQEGLLEYGTTDDSALNTIIHDYLMQTTPRYFGDNWGDDDPDGRIRKAWTGIMGKLFQIEHHSLALTNVKGYSPDGFPFVGEIPNEKGLFISASFQGHGMVLCFLCAEALVKIMGGEEKDIDSWFPNAFKITEERMQKKFQGRLHTKPQDMELKAQ